jgi:phosphoesterase RecJ-like protein
MDSPLGKKEVQQLLDLLDKKPVTAIVCHQNPDGDAVGSSLGLALLLSKQDIPVTVVMPNRPPKFLQWMTGYEKVLFHDVHGEKTTEAISSSQLLFCLDFNAPSRTGKLSDVVAAHPQKVLIDHHEGPDDCWNIALNRIGHSSTSELIYDLMESSSLSGLLDEDIASCIYTGIMTDTGSFRYPATTPRTHIVASELLKTGIDQSIIHSRVLDCNSEDRMHLWGIALKDRLKVLHNGQLAIIALSRSDLHRFHYRPGDTEGLVNQGLSIEGVRMALFLAEQDGYVKMSARSVGDVPVHHFMSAHFSGGGHKNAAGGRSMEPLKETVDKAVKEAGEFLLSHP